MKITFMAALLAASIVATAAEARPRKHRSHVRQVDVTVVAHPAGCPRYLFCGCGVSTKIWGRPIRELYLASNYGVYFNSAAFGPGMVAWRNGHAAYVMGGTIHAAQLYDPNSGYGLTRIHTRDVSGYRFVDPHSPKRKVPGLNVAVASYGHATTEKNP